MTTARYGIILMAPSAGENGSEIPVLHHLYQSHADAKKCAAAYQRDLGREARVAVIEPPLAVVRPGDVWGVLSGGGPGLTLCVHASAGAARASAVAGDELLPAPVRRTMPVNQGTPQFATDPGLAPALASPALAA